MGATAKDCVGAIVRSLQRQYDAAAVHSDEGVCREVPRELLWQLVARVVLARQRKDRSIQDFWKVFRNLINRKLLAKTH
jgi:hypothetical protein